MNRTAYSIRNTKYAIIGQTIGILVSFVSRMIFVKILGVEYLGINGLFSNLLYMLTFADLGVGTAIVYSLYKPLADMDIPKIKALMKLLKKAYISIGIIIFISGVLLIPFLPMLVKDTSNVSNLELIYMSFLVNTSLSYFVSYKRTLIIADQKRYIATSYRYCFFTILNILQIITLLFTRNYILFLVLQIISTYLENLFLGKKIDKIYPYLKQKDTRVLDLETKNTIKKNIKAIIFHKIGDIFTSNTDNLLISRYIGINVVGIYSNYLLIINALNIIFGSIFQAVVASIGSLGAANDNKKMEFVYRVISLINFWIYGFSSICLAILLNPFIKLFFGDEYLLSLSIVIVLVINFYIIGMRKSNLTFNDALGLYWYDRYKPIAESFMKILISLLLVKKYQVFGVLLGTTISTISTCFWIEPYILYKYGLKTSLKKYFSKYLIYTIVLLLAGGLTWFIANLFNGGLIVSLGLKLLICIVIPNLSFMVFFRKSQEFVYLYKMFKDIVHRNYHANTGKGELLND